MERKITYQVAPPQHLLMGYQGEIETELDNIMIRYDLTPDEMATALTGYSKKITLSES